MAFDLKGMAKSSAFATAGGVVLGLGIFWLLSAAIQHLIQPLFNFVVDNGVVVLNRASGVYIGCAAFLAACMIFVLAVLVGSAMIRMAGKS